jgi:spore coat polysaccharide biosynthesis protein SpsF
MTASKIFKTEQEAFWGGDFGSEYIARNQGSQMLASNLALFSKALEKVQKINECIEFGANIGMNLRALKLLYPDQQQYAVEINQTAITELVTIVPPENVFHTSILEFIPHRTYDLVLTKGILIHINPDFIQQVYKSLYRAVGKYLLVCEYYNPTPIQIPYRGYNDRLFKRDFCGELLDKYSDLDLLNYGFIYRRDTQFPQDDITWFLMEKRG